MGPFRGKFRGNWGKFNAPNRKLSIIFSDALSILVSTIYKDKLNACAARKKFEIRIFGAWKWTNFQFFEKKIRGANVPNYINPGLSGASKINSGLFRGSCCYPGHIPGYSGAFRGIPEFRGSVECLFYSMFLQYVFTVCFYSKFLQYVSTVCFYSMFLQYVF